MASASNMREEQLATLREELVELLKANQPHINLGNLQGLYSKHFKKDLAVRKFGVSSVKQLVPLLGDVVEIVTVGKSRFLMLKKLPVATKAQKKGGIRNYIPVENTTAAAKDTGNLSAGSEPSSKRYQTDQSSVCRRDTLMDLRKDLVELFQSSPTGYIELNCLPEKYKWKYKRALNLAEYGITTADSVAYAFRDILEVVSQCDNIKHQHVRIKPECTVAQQNRGVGKQTKPNYMQEKLKKLLQNYPGGLKLNAIGTKYAQVYYTNAPKRQAIKDACKDVFEFFSRCQTPSRRLLRLKPGHSKAGGGGRASEAVTSSQQLPHQFPPQLPKLPLKEQLQGQPHKMATSVKQLNTNQCFDDAVPSSRDKQRKRSASTQRQQQQSKKPRQAYLPLVQPFDTGSLSGGTGSSSKRYQPDDSSTWGRYTFIDVKKDLVELIQSSPEGHIELNCLPETYERKYNRALNLAEYGITTVDSIADTFSDILEVFNQCEHTRHLSVRNKPEDATAQQNRVSGEGAQSNSFQEEVKELLKDFPKGLKLKAVGKQYVKKYHKHTPKNKVIIRMCKDDFEVFSTGMCKTPSRRFIRLKPGHSKACGGGRASDAVTSFHQLPPIVFNNTGLGTSLQAAPEGCQDPCPVGIAGVAAGGIGVGGSGSSGASQAVAASPVPLLGLSVGAVAENPITPPGQGHLGPVLCQQNQDQQQQPQKLKETAVGLVQQEQIRSVSKVQPQCRDDAVESARDKQQKRSASESTQQQHQQQQCKKPRQVYLPPDEPYGEMCPSLLSSQRSSSKQQAQKQSTLDEVAQTLIGNLAAANRLVTVKRVVELLKQHFQATSLENLGLQNESQLPVLNHLMRLQSKVNVFIQAFVQVRPICTLHELRESLAMVDAPTGSTEKLDYAALHLGPLSKQPLVYYFFKFPPTKDDSDIPKITTLHVLEILNKYLSEKDLWRSYVKLEDFMAYVVEDYGVEGPYDLGLRIRSVALAISALRTAYREQKTTMDQARENLKTSMTEEVAEAMEKIRKAVISQADITGHQFPSGPQLEVRRRYCNTTAADAVNRVFNNAYELCAYSMPLRQFCNALRRMVMDRLSRSLFQLAICSGDLCRPDDLPEAILGSDDKDEEEIGPEVEQIPVKSKPTEDQVREELQCYLERIQHGNVNLRDLARIEDKLCQHFGFQDFVSLSRARKTFLQFLALDHPEVLESVGGTLMGLVSSNPSQGSIYRPSRMDLVEFIRQCDPCKESPDTLDICLCAHYQVSSVEELGHGPVNRLSQQIIKMAATVNQPEEQNAVIYETALCASNRRNESKHKEVGLFGSQSLESALACLASAPLLEDLAEWSHWSMVFEPEHGNLKAFLERNPGQSVSPPIEINALEVRPGVLLRLATDTSPDHFAAAAKRGDSINTVGHLASLVAKEGLTNAPLALLSNHMETALNILAVESEGEEMKHRAVIGFVLDCLMAVPLLIGQTVVRQVILNPLTTVIGSEVKSRQLILKACRTTTQRTKIQRLGLLLGIGQWKNSFTEERMPRNMDKEEDYVEDFLGSEDECYFSDLLGMSKAPKRTEAAESSSTTEVSPIDTPSLQDAEELSQTSLEKDEQSRDAQEVLKEEETKEQSEDDFGNLIAASFEDDEESMEVQEDLCKREGDTDDSQAVGTGEEISARGETLDGDTPPVTEETIKTEDEAEPEPDLTPFQRDVLDCRAVIHSICREEFGVGMELDEQTQRLMDRQRERIGRSLKRLSEELYSKDTHFVLELIQNADDNEYETGVDPSLVFLVDRSEVTVLNNEVGFSESNIRALCDIGRSTKGKHKRGYIGHKGIGFKSVFRVTDKPEITSKGYHVCFDQSSDQMGYILPTWVGPEEIQDVAQMEEPTKPWTTRITLPLKGDFQRTTSLVNKFEDVQPSLLLFLNRLRSIIIVKKEENTTSHMSRRDKGGNVVEIRHSKHTDSWLLIKKCLDAAKLQRVGIESTELGLAFPLSDGMSSEQNVFAFLPLRSYGFRFIIQGDFDIPSSREDVDADSAWNQWLLREIAPLFIDALENFKAHYHDDPVHAVCQFLKFVPMESQILTDFFRKVATNIHQRLKATPCMPVLTGQGEDDVCWKLPSETLMCPDRSVRELVCELVPEDTLQEHLSCSYLHPHVASAVSEVLLKSLGVKVLQMAELMNILSSVARAAKQTEEPLSPKTVAQWLTCIYRSRDKYDVSQGTLDQLRSIPMIPLSSGRVVTMEEGSVFFPNREEDRTNQSQGQMPSVAHSQPLQALEEDMCTLDGRVLTSLDSVANSQVIQLLEELGVLRISPRDVIGHHILPVIQSDQWKDKSQDVLVGYVVYIKEQLARQPDVCDLDKIADCIHVVTNHGLIQPRERPVHFTVTYGNPVDLNQDLPGCDWVLLDSCYIFHDRPHRLHPNETMSWNAFFSKLGVLNFLAVEKKVVTVKVEELDVTPWADLGQFWEEPADGVYKIHDNACKEFEELVQANLEMSTIQSQRRCLLEILNHEWSRYYPAFMGAEVFDQSGTKLASTESSFAIHLKTSPWLPSTPIREDNAGQEVFRRPNDIFIYSVRARELLGDHVPYLDAPVQGDGGPMLQFIGLKTIGVLDVNFMISKLKSWCGDEGQSPDLRSGTPFCTSLGHIIRVYSYLEENCRPKELKELFSDHRVVFVPPKVMLQKYEVPVPGQFVHKSLVYWQDPSSLLKKYIKWSTRAQLCALYPQNMEDFFRRQINVDSMPTIKEYAQVLVHCAGAIALPDNARIKEEVLVLYSMLGQKCSALSSSGHRHYSDEHAVGSAQQEPDVKSSSVQFLKSILEGQAVFPTSGNKWVTAEEKPLICDSQSTDIQKLFLDKKEVHLLNFGDRNRLGRVVEGVSGSVDQQYVDVFLEAFGIEMLSDCIKEEFITELTKPSPLLQLFLHDVCHYIQLYMSMQRNVKKEFQSTCEKLSTTLNIAAKLKVMRFMSAKKIDKVYRFTHDPSVFAEQSVECGLQELTEFYIVTGISKNLRQNSNVRREVAKLFSCESTEVQEALFSFIGSLLLEMGSKRGESVEKGINEGICRALGLTFPREDNDEPWEVPKPFIPEEVVFKPTKVKPVREATQPQPSASSLLQGNDGAAIRSWPPRCGTYGPQISTKAGGFPKNEEAVLKMWPPVQQLVGAYQAAPFSTGPPQSTGRQSQPRYGMPHEGTAITQGMPHYQSCQDGVVVRTSGANGGGEVPNPGQVAGQGGSREGIGPPHLHQPSAGGPVQPRPAQAQQEASSPNESSSDPTQLAKNMEGLGSTEEDSWESASLGSGLVKDDNGNGDDNVEGIPAPEMVKGDFYSPPQVQRSAALPHPSTGSIKKFFLPPHTSGEAIEVEFEDIAPGPALLESLEGLGRPLGNNTDTTNIARWGEKLVYLYLLQQAQSMSPEGSEVTVKWVNMQDETGDPYDIVITCGSQNIYVEVKSTIRDQKQVVEISPRQVAFALEMGQAFHLYRVFNAGNKSGVRLGRLQNLALRMDRKEVKLFMYL
ncbi:uncharacterized protein LOC119741972 [Patiria miniata]|uniref:HTH OST-type domain-containing protein n=1 Tax=Patiria miniata TaxID=46514 RepID=A0A914BEM8_PATMI|nr:uncharacterized protein LOC119741972 [Patiria miniata]